MTAITALTCNNEASPRGAGNTAEGSNPEIDDTIGGLRVSVPSYTSGTARGAAAELIVSAHLMAQGYHVFRSVAPTCPCDLVAYKDGQMVRVEVKSLNVRDNGWNPNFPRPTNDQWDVLALATFDGHVLLFPKKDSIEETKADFIAALSTIGVVYRAPLTGRRAATAPAMPIPVEPTE